MIKRTWLYTLGAVLLVERGPYCLRAGSTAAPQSSVKRNRLPQEKEEVQSHSAWPKLLRPPHREIQSALTVRAPLEDNNRKVDDACQCNEEVSRDQGLNPTGKIDAVTLVKLGLGSDTGRQRRSIPTLTTVRLRFRQ